MKKIVFCFLLIGTLGLLFGCSNSSFEYLDDLTHYQMHIVFDDDEKILNAEQVVSYVNNSNDTLKEIKFHLYPNAFREGGKAKVVSQANFDKAYPNGVSYGNIEIKDVCFGSEKASYQVCGEDDNILQVNLNSELFPNEKIDIGINFCVKLANINHRLGYGENAINICNFYPIACVYENGDFVCDLYNSNGDPFYSEVADYDVNFVFPNQYILASSGEVIFEQNEGQNNAQITAKCVRDFGMVLSTKFESKSTKIGEITANYMYFDDKNAENTLNLIQKAMMFFEQNIGKYPYPSIVVAKTNFVHGGMEYPNLVLISDAIQDYSTYLMVIVHELCHQWWYGVVGNNQFDYGWIDEGLTEFCTVLFFEKNPEYERSMENMITAATQNYVTFMSVYSDINGNVDTSMNRALDEFDTEPEYVYNTYVKGMLMFASIFEVVGEKSFVKALKYYYKNNLYKIATPNVVIKSFCVGSGKNLENLFNAWLTGKVKIIAK